jgi:hypothetical protein
MKEIDNETFFAVNRHLETIKKDVFTNLVLDGTPFEKSAGEYVMSLIDLQKQRAEMELALYGAGLERSVK